MRLLVCGGRDYQDAAHLARVLDEVVLASGTSGRPSVCTGGARGADALAALWGEQRGYPVTTYHADWRRYGNSAGPVRNGKMLREFQPTLVVAFAGGRGTQDMVRKARAAGVAVKIVAPGV